MQQELGLYLNDDLVKIVIDYLYLPWLYKPLPFLCDIKEHTLTPYINPQSETGYFFWDLISRVKPKYNFRKSTLSGKNERLNFWIREYFVYNEATFREDLFITTVCEPQLNYLID